jgi:hypothetical protein
MTLLLLRLFLVATPLALTFWRLPVWHRPGPPSDLLTIPSRERLRK